MPVWGAYHCYQNISWENIIKKSETIFKWKCWQKTHLLKWESLGTVKSGLHNICKNRHPWSYGKTTPLLLKWGLLRAVLGPWSVGHTIYRRIDTPDITEAHTPLLQKWRLWGTVSGLWIDSLDIPLGYTLINLKRSWKQTMKVCWSFQSLTPGLFWHCWWCFLLSCFYLTFFL